MNDLYIANYIELIRNAADNDEIGAITNKIYEDGFEDGYNEAELDQREQSQEPINA